MNPNIQKMPTSSVSEDGATTVEDAVATRPQTSIYKATTSKVRWQPSRDERRSDRNLVPQARQSCELKVGAKVLSASLVNESQGGFGVLIDRLDGLTIGKNAELHTNTGSFMVRVVFVQKVAQPENASPECDSWFWLGMKRM